MQHIPRHRAGNISFTAGELDSLNARLPKSLLYLQQIPENLGSLTRDLLRAVSISELAERPHAETIGYMKMALALGIGNFQSALHPGEAINIDLNDRTLHIKGVGTTAYIDPIQWTNLFYLAVILRDQEAVKTLSSIPESLMRRADLQADEVDYAFVRFYKGIYDPAADLGQLAIEAMDATDPKNYGQERFDYFLDLKVPELSLYRCIFSSKPKEFNEKLVEAILKHKKFWEQGDAAYDEEGWIAYPLVAASVVARGARSFSIDVDSPYVPLWLVNREF